ncbi:hypothetical protein M0804_009206 [Polistes exclamans]|nr:hypothetical protein M0804_009206 [Polistes exclamans]
MTIVQPPQFLLLPQQCRRRHSHSSRSCRSRRLLCLRLKIRMDGFCHSFRPDNRTFCNLDNYQSLWKPS